MDRDSSPRDEPLRLTKGLHQCCSAPLVVTAAVPERRARQATATLFFANGCGLGGWLPHIPDIEIWHGLSDVVPN
jgi:hypothetical protein